MTSLVLRTSALALAVTLSGCSLFRSATPDMRSGDLPAPLTVQPMSADAANLPPACSPSDVAALFKGLDASVAAAASKRVFYFGTDASDLSSEATQSLSAHARVLKQASKVKLQVVGHTDERGTHDYNLALGERRANSAAKFLQSQGVAAEQIISSSFGKEKPVADGHDEAAWAKNRRVEIDLRNCGG